MGILNATPDSFSDGRGEEPARARLMRGRALLAAGADISTWAASPRAAIAPR